MKVPAPERSVPLELPPLEAIDGLPLEALPGAWAGLTDRATRIAARLQAAALAPPVERECFLTLEQVGAELGISTREASRLTRMPGGLPRAEISRKCIRVRRSDLLAYVENRLVDPPSRLYSPS